MASLLLKFWGRLLPGKGFGLAAAGSWQRGQVKVELRQATGGLGHAGLGRQQGKKKSIGKVKKKSKKKSNVRLLALADYWRQQKVKKKSKKKSILTAILGQDRAGHLGLWGGYQGHQGQAWLGAEETLGQWLGLGRGPVTLG